MTAEPWTRRQLHRLVAITLVCLLVLTFGWYRIAGEGRLADQVDWLPLIIGAFLAFGCSNLWWLTNARRIIGARRRELVQVFAVESPVTSRHWEALDTRVRITNGQRIHRPACPLIRAKHTVDAGAADGPACGVCAP